MPDKVSIMVSLTEIKPKRIGAALVIDPSRDRASLIRDGLRAAHIDRVGVAHSVDTGLSMLTRYPVDLMVVVDQLDRGTGNDLAHFLRSRRDPLVSVLPIIQVMAAPTKRAVRTGLMVGVDEFIALPMPRAALRNSVRALEQRPRRFVATTEYFGPCRRRIAGADYMGPERRNAYRFAAA